MSDDRRPQRGPVVVGVLDSQAALCAAEFAVDEALDRGVTLRLVHATDGSQQRPGDIKLRFAADILLSVGAAISARGKPVDLDVAIVDRSPIAVLVEESHRASLLCLGMDGRIHNGAHGIGSTAVALAHRAHSSVALVRGGSPTSALAVDNIIVSVGGRAHRDAAIEMAFREAHLRHAPVLAVTTSTPGLPTEPADISRWLQRYPDVHARSALVAESPSELRAPHGGQNTMMIIGADEADLRTAGLREHPQPAAPLTWCCVVVAR